MAKPQSRSLLTWALRSHRTTTVVLGLLVFGMALVTGPTWVDEAKALHVSLRHLALEGEQAAAGLRFLLGPADRLDSIGGYLSYKIYPTALVVLSIYSALQGARIIRGAESRGLFDLWFAATRSRGRILRDRVVAFVVCLSVTVLLLYLGTGLDGAITHEDLWASGIGQCAAVEVVSLLAFSLSLLISQFCETSRVAASSSSALIVVTYLVANSSGSLGALAFLRFLSPFSYYEECRSLVPGVGVSRLAMVVLVLATLALLALATFFYLGRDSDAVSLASLHRARPEVRVFRASRLRQRSLWITFLTEQPVALTAWALGIAGFSAIEASLVPAITRILASSSSSVRTTIANSGGLTVAHYLSYIMSFSAFFVAAFVVTEVGRWASDSSSHRVDITLCQPVSPRRFIAQRALALLVISVAAGLAVVAGAAAGAGIAGVSLDLGGLLRTWAVIVLFSGAVGAVGMLLCAVLRSGQATVALTSLVLACFLLQTLAALFSWPQWTSAPSVFTAFGSPYEALPALGNLIYLAALLVVGVGAALAVMQWGPRTAI